MRICPYCEGEGQVKEWADDYFGNTTSFYHTCDCCEGEGKILDREYKIAKKVYPKSNKELIKMIEGVR
jgi:DnaJ-class molecular chaperone